MRKRRKGVVLQLEWLGKALKNPHRRNRLCHEILTIVLKLLIVMKTVIGM
jgi:hypothetical protein